MIKKLCISEYIYTITIGSLYLIYTYIGAPVLLSKILIIASIISVLGVIMIIINWKKSETNIQEKIFAILPAISLNLIIWESII